MKIQPIRTSANVHLNLLPDFPLPTLGFLNYISDMKIPKYVIRDVYLVWLGMTHLIGVKRTFQPSLSQHLSQYCTNQKPTSGWTDHPLDRFTSAQYRTESPAVLDDETPIPRKDSWDRDTQDVFVAMDIARMLCKPSTFLILFETKTNMLAEISENNNIFFHCFTICLLGPVSTLNGGNIEISLFLSCSDFHQHMASHVACSAHICFICLSK